MNLTLVDRSPSEGEVSALLKVIQPGSKLIGVGALPGSYSNLTHLIEARSQQGNIIRLVVRRYVEIGEYDRGEKARREFDIFRLLQESGIPGPEPVYLDEDGEILGAPGIVTSYVTGMQIMEPSDPKGWARSLAQLLGRIHAIRCHAYPVAYLLDANREASWFLHKGQVPDFMKADPNGPRVWEAVRRLMPEIVQVEPGLVHVDYWPGNILWNEDRIVAVLDWEEAACGDGAIDVAYCRMGMMLDGMGVAAESFLAAYEAETGRRVANLGLWELCAAARPMFAPEVYELDDSERRQRLDAFIKGAIGRAGM